MFPEILHSPSACGGLRLACRRELWYNGRTAAIIPCFGAIRSRPAAGTADDAIYRKALRVCGMLSGKSHKKEF